MTPRLLAAALLAAPLPAAAACPALLDQRLTTLQGKPDNLCRYEGQVVLVVNTASYCGYTKQYEGLEALYQKYRARASWCWAFRRTTSASRSPGPTPRWRISASAPSRCASRCTRRPWSPARTRTRSTRSSRRSTGRGAEVELPQVRARTATGEPVGELRFQGGAGRSASWSRRSRRPSRRAERRSLQAKSNKAHYGVDLTGIFYGRRAFPFQRPRARPRPAGPARPGRRQRHPGGGGQGGHVLHPAARSARRSSRRAKSRSSPPTPSATRCST